MVFICLSSVGLPGLNGFVGEVLSLMGIFEAERARNEWPVYAVVGACGIVLGAWYLFTMLQRVFFGPLREPPLPSHSSHGLPVDLTRRELSLMAPIVILCVVIGIFPQPIIDASQRDVDVIADIAKRARNRAHASAVESRSPHQSSTPSPAPLPGGMP